MKNILLFLPLTCMTALVFAQHHFHYIAITNNATADSIILPMLGVISGPDSVAGSPGRNLTQRLHEIGIRQIRNNDYYDDRLDMEGIWNCGNTGTTGIYPSWECEPDSHSMHWEKSDAQMMSYINGGFEPFLRLGGEWENAFPGHDFKGPQDSLMEERWIRAAIMEAERYLAFPNNNIRYLNVWTEFPGEHFWDRTDEEFYTFFAKAVDSLMHHFPQVKVGGPGVLEDSAALGILNACYQRGVQPDFLDYHIFTNNSARYYIGTKRFEDILLGNAQFAGVPWANNGFFDNTELICGAYMLADNYTNNGVPVQMTRQEADSIFNHQAGAAILTADWIALQNTNATGAFIYRCGDPASDPAADPDDVNSNLGRSGLFHGDAYATYKPVSRSIRFWSHLADNFPHMMSTPYTSDGNNGGRLFMLVGENSSGEKALLISNTNADTSSFLPVFGSDTLDADDYSYIGIYTVDDSQDGLVPETWNGDSIIMPSTTVRYITLTNSEPAFISHHETATFDLNVFPNPATESLNIITSHNLVGEELSVFDVMGKRIISKQITSAEMQLEIFGMPRGIYVLKAGAATKKFVVE